MYFLLYSVTFILLVTTKISKCLNLACTCDNVMKFYIDGVIAPTTNGGNWQKVDHLEIPSNTEILGVYCRNSGGPGAIIASLSDGRVTNTKDWKCTNTEQPGWTTKAFDDSSWVTPVSFGKIGAQIWSVVTGISLEAEWIWTTGPISEPADNEVWCRTAIIVDGGWSSFTAWSSCPVSCGSGTQSRTRTCTNPKAFGGGKDCVGGATETQTCTKNPCPVDGGWTAWLTNSICVCPLGLINGIKQYTRTCTNPIPQHGGKNCDTSQNGATKTKNCNCPRDGGWSSFGAWSTCPVSCGGGTQSRTRTCTNPTVYLGGKDCVGVSSQTQNCNTNPCPIDGGWTAWLTNGTCYCPLGDTDGIKHYTRSCTDPTPQHGGKYCDTSQNGETKTKHCNCPRVACNKLPTIQNGYYDHPNCTTTGRYYKDSCKGHCDTGYYNTAGELFTCTKYGTWSFNNNTQCQIHHCPGIPSVTSNTKCPSCSVLPTVLNVNFDNGVCTTTGVDYNNTCSASCEVGYNLVGHTAYHCTSTGQWNSTIFPHCQIEHCAAIPVPGNGSYSPLNCQTQGLDYPQKCQLVCDYGYRLLGSSVQQCADNGTWTDQWPYCEAATCEPPSEGLNSTLIHPPVPIIFGMYSTYECIHGYEIQSGDKIRYCLLTRSWSGFPLNCQPIKCPPEATPTHTIAVNSTGQTEFTYEDIIAYECEVGYELLSGDLTRMCQLDKTFSGSAPLCRKQLCYPLPVTPNAKLVVGSGEYLDAVTYECLPGYEHVSGDLKRHCLVTKVWNGTSPTCAEMKCDDPPAIPNISHHVEAVTYKSRTSYNCLHGYSKVSGDDYLVCNISGQWEGKHLHCEEIVCAQPLTDSQTANTIFGYAMYNKTLKECTTGYKHSQGISTMMCQKNKLWEIVNPVCKEINCGLPHQFEYTELSYGPTTYNSMAEYSCTQGSILSTNVQTQCTEDGWSTDSVSCTPMVCPDTVPLGADVQLSTGKQHSDSLITNCAAGYSQVEGDTARKCQFGSWSGLNILCQEITCENLDQYNDVIASNSGNNINDTRNYQCQPGHIYSYGELNRTCTQSGLWTGKAPVCSKILCLELSFIWPIQFIVEGSTPGSYANQSCAKSFTLKNTNHGILKCSSNGKWEGTITACEAITCGSVSKIQNGHVEVNNFTYMGKATIFCNEGFELNDGDDYLLCGNSGTWTGDIPICKLKECQLPYMPTYGYYKLSSMLNVGSTVTFECEHRYLINGTAKRTCLANATWSGIMPTCERIHCGKPSKIANAHWNWDQNHYPITDKAIYSCEPSYSIVNNDSLVFCLASGQWSNTSFQCKRKFSANQQNGLLNFDFYELEEDKYVLFKHVDYYINHIFVGVMFLAIFIAALLLFCCIDISNIKKDIKFMKRNIRSYIKNKQEG